MSLSLPYLTLLIGYSNLSFLRAWRGLNPNMVRLFIVFAFRELAFFFFFFFDVTFVNKRI